MPEVQSPNKPVNKYSSREEKLDSGWRFVKLPEVDLYEIPFDGIWINKDYFGPGTHLVPKEIADELENILERWTAATVRLLQPGKDKRLKRQLREDVVRGMNQYELDTKE